MSTFFIFFLVSIECLLTLKAHAGWFDSSIIPNHASNCSFRFSSTSTATSSMQSQSAGLLVKLLRFNVPCSSSGFLQFNQSIKMCGKLEEMPENRRTLYFRSYANTTWTLYNHPKVYFIYKLVDHCYNVTLFDRNSSFVIQPTYLALKCHFNIHLPFGNQIELKLQVNENGAEINSPPTEIKLSKGKFNYSELNLGDFSLTSDFSLANEVTKCSGILIEIINRVNEKWNQCIAPSEARQSFFFTLKSSDNVLFVRITKKQNETKERHKLSEIDNTKVEEQQNEHLLGPSISLEYSAVPIRSIASQCAFGWILVGQFCLSSFTDLMTWQDAESYCNDMGGHLASIRSESEQQMIDKMLMNR